MENNRAVLIGFDLDIIDLAESETGLELKGYTDKFKACEKFESLNINYLGTDEDWLGNHASLDYEYIMGMNIPGVRKKVYQRFHGKRFMNLISDKSYISKRSKIDEGNVIQHNVSILSFTEIGKGCLLNVGSSIHHESSMGDFSILAPGAIVLGRVNIGSEVYIGSGAIIKEGCKIGSGSYIGAGSVVIEDIPENSKVVGIPARKFL